MTLALDNEVDVNDLVVEHNSDGSHKGASNLQFGLDASKPANPDPGDVYVATNTSVVYFCFVDNTWTALGTSTDEKIKISANDNTAAYPLTKLVAQDASVATVEN